MAKGVRILLAAPTGRAAKRMSDQTGIEAKTVHRLLEIDPKNGGFRKGVDDPLDCDLLVLVETSMVDVPLMNAITKAVPKRAGCEAITQPPAPSHPIARGRADPILLAEIT